MPAAGGLRADSLRGHRRHIRLFFLSFFLDVRFHSHFERRHISEDGRAGDPGLRGVCGSLASDVDNGIGDEPDRLALVRYRL
jgi:hypothetical protein